MSESDADYLKKDKIRSKEMFEEFAKKMKKKREVDFQFKNMDEELAETAPETVSEPVVAHRNSAMVAKAEDSTSNLELKIINPERFEDVITVAEHLINGCTVVLNLELMDVATIQRMLDFLHGVCFPINGDVKFVSKSTYIITPSNIDVSDK